MTSDATNPPDDAAPDAPPAPSTSRPPTWDVATGIFWGLIFLAFIGVWKASQEVGLATWWRGPRSEPQPVLVQILPLVAPSVLIVAAMMRWPRLGLLSVVGAVATIAIALGDLGTVDRLAMVELALGVAALVFSVASLAADRAVRQVEFAPPIHP